MFDEIPRSIRLPSLDAHGSACMQCMRKDSSSVATAPVRRWGRHRPDAHCIVDDCGRYRGDWNIVVGPQPNDRRVHVFSEDGYAHFSHFSIKRIRFRDELNNSVEVPSVSTANADIQTELRLREV